MQTFLHTLLPSSPPVTWILNFKIMVPVAKTQFFPGSLALPREENDMFNLNKSSECLGQHRCGDATLD